jgi:hypothetical protein
MCHRKKERRRIRRRIMIIIRNGAKTISLQTLFGKLNKSSREQLTCKKHGGCTPMLIVTSLSMKNL